MKAVLGIVLLVVTSAHAVDPRFFLAGDGALTIGSVFTKGPVAVRYRRDDGSYDPEALATLRRVLRSKDGREGPITPRFVELLGYAYVAGGRRALHVVSGYRSPAHNAHIRKRGAKAAGNSLHTEGLAADLAFPKAQLAPLWLAIRERECCGAGYYASSGFLHLDVGQPRFWEATTSRVDENLSAGNARVFARTEYDRYAPGDPIAVTLHAISEPPIRVARDATLRAGDGSERRVTLEGEAACLTLDHTGSRIIVGGTTATERATLILATCEPRPGATPGTIETNPIVVR